jgi:hypothetical protein
MVELNVSQFVHPLGQRPDQSLGDRRVAGVVYAIATLDLPDGFLGALQLGSIVI